MMDEEFCTKLEQVFRIIETQPEAVVDDTALDRLLVALETLAQNEVENNDRYMNILVSFFRDFGTWNHPITASFGLRLAGSVGVHVASVSTKNDIVKSSIIECINGIFEQDHVINNPTVTHGFYTCFKCLASHILWIPFLESYIQRCLRDLSSSFLYIRKVSSEALAIFLKTALHNQVGVSSLASILTFLQDTEDVIFFESLANSITMVTERDIETGAKFLHMYNFLQHVFTIIKEHPEDKSVLGLLDSIINLLTAFTSNNSNCVSWSALFPLTSKRAEDELVEFVEYLKDDPALYHVLPKLCASLLRKNTNEGAWNKKMIVYFLSLVDLNLVKDDVKCCAQSVLLDNVKCWKNILTTSIVVMSKIDHQLYCDEHCARLLNAWLTYCLRVFEISLNHVEDKKLSDRYIALIRDKKITRICFSYIKQVPYKDLTDAKKREYLNTLWTVLQSSSDSAQIICLGLDTVSNFIQENGLQPLLSIEERKHEGLATILNMRMWDMNWEVRESLLSLLIVVLEKAQADNGTCKSFMKKNRFWCSFGDALDDEESYVRAKATKLLEVLISVNSVAQLYYEEQNTDLMGVWKKLEEKFMCVERQDDMFTRRSVLALIKDWIEHDIIEFSVNPEDDNILELKIIKNILINASQDFDWEIRRQCSNTLTAVVMVIRKYTVTVAQKALEFMCEIFNGTFAKMICDCEYVVRVNSVRCLRELKESIQCLSTNKLSGISSENTEYTDNGGSVLRAIKTIEDLVTFVNGLCEMKTVDLQEMLQSMDFDGVETSLKVMDNTVRNDPCSFMEDIIASTERIDGNLLDCY